MSRYVKPPAPGTFASRLWHLQRERGLSNEALARESGISVSQIAKYRAGKSEPRNAFGEPTFNGRSLAAALRVEVEALLPDPEMEAA